MERRPKTNKWWKRYLELSSKYNHVVVAIEKSKNLEEYKVEDLQGSIEAHELRLKERNLDNNSDQALHDSYKPLENRRKLDKKRVQCYNCRNYGHFASDCKSNRWQKGKEEEAMLSQGECSYDSGEDHCLLMATTKNVEEQAKDVEDIDLFSVEAESIGKVMIQKRDGRRSYISNVLFVPKMKNNLLSLRQLLEKRYIMEMKNGVLNVFDKHKQMILKAPLSSNKTFRIQIHIGENKGLKGTPDQNSWLWHQRKVWIYLIRRKNEVFEKFQRFKAQAERMCDLKLKQIRLDNGGEYMSKDFREYCIKEGINHERARQPSSRIEDYEVFPDSSNTTEVDLMHMTLLAEMEPVCLEEAHEQAKWIEAMKEELRSIK
ncbi:PREDICTED: uncharacterized protein LOC109359910 [Lupinus angustifolius]|uniref:uncharacterized protein LOC109359910 n=1 Tax=Lupinus angustifolius TaxID=3871 RepID=UPI00092E3965|nr:PREDICTED: uncharacterized protein LOC109359910 [Lupinus angustifolius]